MPESNPACLSVRPAAGSSDLEALVGKRRLGGRTSRAGGAGGAGRGLDARARARALAPAQGGVAQLGDLAMRRDSRI